jgi:class 3 adenylate cyclase
MDAPEGTLTMLFSDIEGSTKLLEHLGDGYVEALAAHHRIVRAALAAHDARSATPRATRSSSCSAAPATRCSPQPTSSAVSSRTRGPAPRRCGSASVSTRVSRARSRVATNTELQGYERQRHEALLATLRERLGPERLERMRAAGRAVTLDDVLDAVV